MIEQETILVLTHPQLHQQAIEWFQAKNEKVVLSIQQPYTAIYEVDSDEHKATFQQRLFVLRQTISVPCYQLNLTYGSIKKITPVKQFIRVLNSAIKWILPRRFVETVIKKMFYPHSFPTSIQIRRNYKYRLKQRLIQTYGAWYQWYHAYMYRKRITACEKLIEEGKKSPVIKRQGIPASNDFFMLHLHADPWYRAIPGGTLAHVRGVLVGTDQLGVKTHLITPDGPPELSWTQVRVERESMLSELDELRFMEKLKVIARQIIRKERPAILYQRHFRHALVGVELAREFNLPLILENNASIVWADTHWTAGLQFPELVGITEQAALCQADLIVCISEQVAKTTRALGVPEERIIVNPNGVDENRFHPGIDGSRIRRKWNLGDKKVVGFLGTFGPWHGAEVLANAVKLVSEKRSDIHFLFIGEGSRRVASEEITQQDGVERYATFTGRVPSEEAPEYLAACDILASPHVHNHDGSEFFGSPTKLFEYMAMGKPIIASGISQLAVILEHQKTAFLVTHSDPEALAEGILCLVDDPALSEQLGKATRDEVVAKYTWRANMQRNFDRLRMLQRL